MSEITSKNLTNKANHTTCECGNITIHEYSWCDDNDCKSCPLCMVEWQSEQIKAMKELVYELSSKSKDETAVEINKKYAEFMIVDLEYLNDNDIDFSKP